MKCAKKHRLLTLLRKQWVTALESQRHCGILSLSQRVSEWRAQGIVIRDRWIESDGSRYKSYRAAK